MHFELYSGFRSFVELPFGQLRHIFLRLFLQIQYRLSLVDKKISKARGICVAVPAGSRLPWEIVLYPMFK